jgi:hypothetical protein
VIGATTITHVNRLGSHSISTTRRPSPDEFVQGCGLVEEQHHESARDRDPRANGPGLVVALSLQPPNADRAAMVSRSADDSQARAVFSAVTSSTDPTCGASRWAD